MGRSVADIAIMLGIMAGPDRKDPTAAQVDIPDFSAELGSSLKGLRFGLPDTYYMQDLTPEVETAIQAAIKVLQELGGEIKTVSMPMSHYASAACWIINYSEAFVLHRTRFAERAKDYTPAFYHKVAAGGLTSSFERIVAQRIGQMVTREFAEVMREVDVVVTPTSRVLATDNSRSIPASRRSLPWSADMASVTRAVSLAGYPGLSVPIGFASDNTGMAIQLVGRPFEETTLFRAGSAYERATSWKAHRPPAFPKDIPARFGSSSVAGPPEDTNISPDWVLEMARLLEYEFITESDAQAIAPMISPVKTQMQAAMQNLKMDIEPPSRPAGQL
jgi:aspartyl-tRNA(Asn)/glutamyl-tRNA(Gln) amidotransferase subunit A